MEQVRKSLVQIWMDSTQEEEAERPNKLMFVNANLRVLSMVNDKRKKNRSWKTEDEPKNDLEDEDEDVLEEYESTEGQEGNHEDTLPSQVEFDY